MAQDLYDARQSVIINADVQENPAQIKLSWLQDTANGGYTIWRKLINEEHWGDSLIYLPPNSTFWVDTSIQIGIAYEYQILKSLPAFPYGNGTPNFGSGYIYSGIKVEAQHHRGACLVVIERSIQRAISFEIARLLDDLQNDGWTFDTISVTRNAPVTLVKNSILKWQQKNPGRHQALFLLGRVPVPYSGEIATDGHHSDHRGAWPCDGYYGTIDGLWTDQTVNNKTAASSRNYNVPGDGKFDNNVLPSKVKLLIGRVDFSNMNKFSESEEQLLKRYLDKNHDWRIGKIKMEERGLIDNNFPLDLEALGQSGWKNFAPMFGINKVKELTFRQTLLNQSYLWSYGCGGGGPESASDISNTTNFTSDSLQTIFTMLFGSYFGDWDYPNNFLRAAIASKTCLNSSWGNRPNWLFHHMALGEPIGYAAQLAMNNSGLYTPRFYGGYVSTALMGDPTICMHVLEPIQNLVAIQEGHSIRLTWKHPKSSSGFYIYRRYEKDSLYHLLNAHPISDTSFMDHCVQKGLISYIVRSTRVMTSGSGSYSILSSGVSTKLLFDTSALKVNTKVNHCDAGKSNGLISITASGSCEPYQYVWNNGSTTKEINNLAPGKYCVTISDCNNCSQEQCMTVNASTLIEYTETHSSFQIHPNPCSNQINLNFKFLQTQKLSLALIDANGTILATKFIEGVDINLKWDVEVIPPGQYWIQIIHESGYTSLPFTKSEL
ncbi:MAG TPA: hypothetical protein PK006_09370 [Saprospiraceae bacterium]|nr:hypothetical protein [Saprospiraceae bacterium]